MEWGFGGRGTQTTSFPTVTKKIEMEASFSVNASSWGWKMDRGLWGGVCVSSVWGVGLGGVPKRAGGVTQ